MERVQKEIDDVLKAHNNEVTYESVAEMKYLESCIDETLRLYPALPFLNREVTIPYKIPGTDIVLEKGTPISISLLGMHRDPKNFPEPMKFDPERFYLQSDKKSIPYAPFGDGPRACIGLRLGKLQTKVGLLMLLSKFKYELAKGTPDQLPLVPQPIIITPVGGLKLKISYRD